MPDLTPLQGGGTEAVRSKAPLARKEAANRTEPLLVGLSLLAAHLLEYLNDVQEVVTDLVETYAPDRVEEYLGKDDDEGGDQDGGDDVRPVPNSAPGGSSSSSWSSSSGRSPYYDVDTEDFAEPDPVEVDTTDRKQGAHPTTGKPPAGTSPRTTTWTPRAGNGIASLTVAAVAPWKWPP